MCGLSVHELNFSPITLTPEKGKTYVIQVQSLDGVEQPYRLRLDEH